MILVVIWGLGKKLKKLKGLAKDSPVLVAKESSLRAPSAHLLDLLQSSRQVKSAWGVFGLQL